MSNCHESFKVKKQQTNTNGFGTTNDKQDSSNDVKTQNADTHNAQAPVSDAIPTIQSVEPTTVETEPECDQIMQQVDEPLNLTITKIDDKNYSIDLSSGALDLSLKK